MKTRRFASLVFFFLLLILGSVNVQVKADPQPIETLHVSLPAGTIVGANPDPWLDEGWLLNITEHHGSFVVRINETERVLGTYDTHLIIALNDVAYNNLVDLYVDVRFPTRHITIPKTAFQYGVPKPYNVWTWPDDVYPTWFNDTLVNLGTIRSIGMMDYKDVTVSVAFSNATCARMHFDAYGCTSSCYQPTEPEHVVRNPDSKDSTVIFSPPEQCEVTFLTDPVCCHYSISFEGETYHNGTIDTFAYGTSGPATANCADGWVFDHWEVTGNVEVSNTTENPTCVTINCGGTLKAVCTCGPCEVTFLTDPVCSYYYITFQCQTYHNGTTGTFAYGTSDNATAYCPAGWEFDHWETTGNVEISCTTTQNPATVTICCGGTLKAVFRPTAQPPEADFTWCPPAPKVNETITFDASASTPDGGSIVSYKWDFGDGNITTVTDSIITHVYNSVANYTVILNVTDSEGEWDTETKTIKVVQNPTALFTATLHSKKVTFNASSSYDPDGYIVSYKWDFGDGNITTVIDPVTTHNYAAAGTYNVTLTVIDNDGLNHSAKNNLTIRTLAGDLNLDGKVDIRDVTIAAMAFGSKLGDENWNPIADLNNDEVINIRDITIVALEFGKPV